MKHSILNKLFVAGAFALLASATSPAFADAGEQPVDDVKVDEHKDVKSDDVSNVDTGSTDEQFQPAPAPVEDVKPVEDHSDHSVVAPVEDHSNVDNSVTYEDNSVVVHEHEEVKLDEPTLGASKDDKVNYWSFKRFGLGAGGSFAAHDRNQAFKLDFNAGPLYVAYYADKDNHRNVLGAFAPELPLYQHARHPVSFVPGAGVQYNGKDSGVKMNVVAFGHVDVGLFKNFHLRAGPTFFIPTNAGDTDGINGDIRRESAKRPRGDVVLRVGF